VGRRTSEDCIIEVTQIGASLKVSAIDPESGLEVSVSGPAGSGMEALTQLAMRKLAYRRQKKDGQKRS
jgi:hypothetical protein